MEMLTSTMIKIGWPWWVSVQLWFCNPITTVDNNYYVVSKRLNDTLYVIKHGTINEK